VADKGRHVTVTGPLAFTAGETALPVTVTQRSTGALAEGSVQLSGNGQMASHGGGRRPGEL